MRGNSEMGMKKHSASGYKNGAGKSPRFRLHQKMEAEKNERKARKSTCIYNSVSEAIRSS